MLSLVPGNKLPEVKFDFFRVDTLVHLFFYAVMLFLMAFRWEVNKMNLLNFRVYLLLIGTCSVIGFTVEIVQGYFIPKRFFSWDDALANGIGTIFGAFLYNWIGIKLLNYKD